MIPIIAYYRYKIDTYVILSRTYCIIHTLILGINKNFNFTTISEFSILFVTYKINSFQLSEIYTTDTSIEII